MTSREQSEDLFKCALALTFVSVITKQKTIQRGPDLKPTPHSFGATLFVQKPLFVCGDFIIREHWRSKGSSEEAKGAVWEHGGAQRSTREQRGSKWTR